MAVSDLKTIDIGDGAQISYREAGSGTPAVILHGLGGRSAPPEFVKQIADAYPGIAHHTIDGIGHQIAFEKPEKFVGLLRDHLDAAESSAQAAE